jgi:hypothetical protein
MTRLLAALILVIAVGWWPSQAAAAKILKPAEAAAPAGCADDGHLGAPAGRPQFLGLLSDVRFRPPCAVAGVDYRVGPAATQVFKLPTDRGALPAGVTYNPKTHVVGCSGTNGAVIDGVDFATHGASIDIDGCNDLTIQNSRIRSFWTTPDIQPRGCSFPIQQENNSNNLTLRNVEVDGGGAAAVANCSKSPAGMGETINLKGTGFWHLDYVYIHDVDQHFINWGGPPKGVFTPSTPVLTHSVITGCGYEQGVHCNGMQWVGAITPASRIEWNFFYDPQPSVASGPIPVNFAKGSNQFTLAGGITQGSFRAGVHVTSPAWPGTATVTAVDQTTLVITVNKKSALDGRGAVESPDMYPIGLVLPIRYVNNGGQGLMRNGTISHNTMYGAGPVVGSGYMIGCGGEGPNLNDKTIISDNWYDPRGVKGAFLTSRGCTNLTASGNRRMDTGATVAPP